MNYSTVTQATEYKILIILKRDCDKKIAISIKMGEAVQEWMKYGIYESKKSKKYTLILNT